LTWPRKRISPWSPPRRTRFSRWQEQSVTPLPRYQGVLEEMQVLAQRLLIFGMHVHIGIEDRAFAIDAMNVCATCCRTSWR
jgi:gamma-glutamyl:cysteine ligase YbdK (ATP-grasp superfamily)